MTNTREHLLLRIKLVNFAENFVFCCNFWLGFLDKGVREGGGGYLYYLAIWHRAMGVSEVRKLNRAEHTEKF